MRPFSSKHLAACAFAGLAFAGTIGLLVASRWGAGLSPDSVFYVQSARDLLQGRGYSSTHFPPLFPALLAAIGFVGVDPLEVVRWLNAFLFGGNVILIGAMLSRYTQSSVWLPIAGAIVAMSSTTLISVHLMAWSEPTFLFLGYSGLFFLSEHLERPRWRLLLASAGAIALAFLARYAGVALVGTGALSLLILSRESPSRRALDAVVFGAASSLPMAAWLLRNVLVSGSSTSRQLAFHPITVEHLRDAVSSAGLWFFPGIPLLRKDQQAIAAIAAISLAAACAVLAVAWSRRAAAQPAVGSRFAGVLSLFVCVYVALLVVSVSLFDAHTKLGLRILSPAYVSAVCLGFYLADRLLSSVRRKELCRMLMVLLFVTYTGFSFAVAKDLTVRVYSVGEGGYSSKRWRTSKTLRRLEELPSSSLIFTNGPEAIYIRTGRSSVLLPEKLNPHTLEPNERLQAQMSHLRSQTKERGGFVVYFKSVRRPYLPTETELQELLPLRLIAREADGVVYQITD